MKWQLHRLINRMIYRTDMQGARIKVMTFKRNEKNHRQFEINM